MCVSVCVCVYMSCRAPGGMENGFLSADPFYYGWVRVAIKLLQVPASDCNWIGVDRGWV